MNNNKKYTLSQKLHDLQEVELVYDDIKLRIPNYEELIVLSHNGFQNILPEGKEDYLTAWASETDLEVFKLRLIHHHMSKRLELGKDDWELLFVVFANDVQPVGAIDLRTRDFPKSKTVETGSWLALDQQGNGYGTKMRKVVLELAFRSLGAEYAQSKAHIDNVASNAISNKLGYQKNGVSLRKPTSKNNKKAIKSQNWLLEKDDFKNVKEVSINIPERLLNYLSLDDEDD